MRKSFLTHTHAEPAAVRSDAEAILTDSGRHRRRALMIAYRFPPQGGGGVQRTLKFVKYLPERGWLPVVHTVSNPHWPLQDATLLSEVPQSVKVYRTPTFEFERLRNSTDSLLSAERPAAASGERAGGRPKRSGGV